MFKSALSTKELGNLIKQARKNSQLTQHEAAALCGVSVPFFNGIENGKETAEIGKVLHVCQELGIQLQATLFGT